MSRRWTQRHSVTITVPSIEDTMPETLADPATCFDRPAFHWRHRDADSPVLLICEHASDYIPPAYANLGLAEGVQREHIGWDIGAAALARVLSDRLRAPLICAGYSRLLIDLNRPLTAPDSIPSVSDGWRVPANVAPSAEDVAARRQCLFHAFHAELASFLDTALARGKRPRVVAIHSFTPVMGGVARPWEIGVLYQDAEAYARQMMEGLAAAGIRVGDNQPYQIHVDEDMTVPVHGDGRGLPCVLIEVRNDLIRTSPEVEAWAERLLPWL